MNNQRQSKPWSVSSPDTANRCPAYIPQHKLRELARMLPDEDWGFVRRVSTHDYPILLNLIQWTITRAFNTNQYGEASHPARRCFCTGLLSTKGRLVYGVLEPNDAARNPEWQLTSWHDGCGLSFHDFDVIPLRTSFCTNPRDLVWRDLPIDPDHLHIAGERVLRWPERFREVSQLHREAVLDAAVDQARREARLYPSIAAAYWYPESDRISLLLPLYLDRRASHGLLIPDLALVLVRFADHYEAPTCLELDEAYMDARLLGRPTQDWLLAFRQLKPRTNAA